MSYSRLLLSISTVVVIASYPAQAGFKWDHSSSVNIDTMEKQPVDDVTMMDLSPVQQVESMVDVPMQEPKREPEETPVEQAMDTIEGFGRDVPLSYAVVSIVPASYAYSFGADVNPAQPITWKGGHSWDKVLEDAVSPNNLSVRIDGNKVVVYKKEQVVETAKPAMKVLPVEHAPSVESSEREVFVRRGSGNVVAVKRYETPDIKVDATEQSKIPLNIIETTNLTVEDKPEEVVIVEPPQEEVMVIKKIDPNLPAEVTSYEGNDDNVFEVVVSQQAPSRVLDSTKISTFHAKSGQTVRGVIEKWSDEAGVQVYWETKYDFPVDRSMALTATYPMAVQALLGRYDGMEPRPTVKLHPNWPHGPSIITVK